MPKPRLFRVLVTFSYLRLCLPKSRKGVVSIRDIPMSGAREVLQAKDGISSWKALVIQLSLSGLF